MIYSKYEVEKLRQNADIRKVIPGADEFRPSSYVRCPSCGHEGKSKGLQVVHRGSSKNYAHCYACGFHLNDAIAAVMYFEYNNDKSKYPDAIKSCAQQCGIFIQSEEEKNAHAITTGKEAIAKSFCQRQLEGSGLTVEDVMVKERKMVGNEVVEQLVPAFRKGSIDYNGTIHPDDDEMLIYYYRLDGTMEQYSTRGLRGALRPYIRVRWSNPALHTPKDSNREVKYQTPKGAPTKFYFPQRIRDAYAAETPIDTLVIQEGEKKAEKACKHGIMSVGIQGIYNIGNKDTGLPMELQYLVQRCKVKNVVLLMDSDWDHLSRNLAPDEAVDYRPRQFAGAAKKFKRYVNSLHNQNIDVDIYFGHINANAADEKGIDDLLCGTLRGKEEELVKDMDFALHAHDGIGKYCSIHIISTLSDNKIDDYWLLNDKDAFFAKYSKQLQPLGKFRFNHFLYAVKDGQVQLASRFATNKEFWTTSVNESTGATKVAINPYEALRFVGEAGFYRMHRDDLEDGDYRFVHVEDGIVYPSSESDIRGFVWAYIQQSTKRIEVLDHFAARLSNDLSRDKLERLDMMADNFDRPQPYHEEFFFDNGMCTVTPEGVEWSNAIMGTVWADKVHHHKFRRVHIINHVGRNDDGTYYVDFTKEGMQCDMVKYVLCTSNFWWQKNEWSQDEENQYSQHVLNKLTCAGYLISEYKYLNEMRAVVCMDSEMSDVGQSNGGTGKSLFGIAIGKMVEQVVVDGKALKADDDFLYSEVTLRTRNIHVEDVAPNFKFERFYVGITGDLKVNPKQAKRYTIPMERSPRLLITTNHAIMGSETTSSKRRIVYMAFSNFFSRHIDPEQFFGHRLFSDWDSEQWNLFYNFMIDCAWLYMAVMTKGWARPGEGLIHPPMHDLEQRTLKQMMSESLYQWAEVFYDQTGGNINTRIPRGEVFRNFKEHFPDARSGITQSNFKTKLMYYCQFKGFHFNPQKLNKDGISYRGWQQSHPGESFIGSADKSGGVEYFAIYDTENANNEPF